LNDSILRRRSGSAPKNFLTRILALGLMICSLPAGAAAPVACKILILGDSLSAGYGLTRGAGWVDLLRQRLGQQSQDCLIVNASISGETTIGGRNRLPALLAAHSPSLLILQLGANDGLRGLPVKNMEDNLIAMVQAAQRTRARTLLIGIRMPPNYGVAYTTAFANSFQTVAARTRIPLVPFFFEGIAGQASAFQADGIHPNEQAQQRLLDNVWPEIARQLK
jgi:acyl-CoA thioesterase-1